MILRANAWFLYLCYDFSTVAINAIKWSVLSHLVDKNSALSNK